MNGYSPFLRHFHDLKEVDGNTVLWVGLVRFAHSSIKHLFFNFAGESKKAIPYFRLDIDTWEQIQLFILQDVR